MNFLIYDREEGFFYGVAKSGLCDDDGCQWAASPCEVNSLSAEKAEEIFKSLKSPQYIRIQVEGGHPLERMLIYDTLHHEYLGTVVDKSPPWKKNAAEAIPLTFKEALKVLGKMSAWEIMDVILVTVPSEKGESKLETPSANVVEVVVPKGTKVVVRYT